MKNKRLILSLFVLSIFIVPFILLFFKNSEIEKFKYKIFANTVEKAQLHFQTLIKEKQNTTATIGLGLSINNKIIDALKNKDTSDIDLKAYSFHLNKSSDFKNVWFHLISKDGISLQRSWSNFSGDNISDFRADLKDVLSYPRLLNTISVGIFDMTFKSMVPIYDKDKNFLGIIEVITHFNSISKKLKEKDVSSLILADKKYKSQLKKSFTRKFIGDYYVANMDVEDELLIYFKSNNFEKYIDLIKPHKYYIDKELNKIVTYNYIKNIKNDLMGHFLLFIDLDKIDMEKINQIEYIYNLYIALSLISILLFSYFIYSGIMMSYKIEYKFSEKMFFMLLISYIILAFISSSLIGIKYNNDKEFYKSQLKKDSILDFNAIVDKNRVISNLIFSNKIDNDKVKNLVKNGKREELYQYFLPTYKEIQREYNVRQVHFHKPDSISFLRMHMLNKYGDSLKQTRDSVNYVQSYFVPFEGFEEGKFYNGFRYIYPLFLDNKFIGSFEIGFDIYSIIDNYFKLYNIDKIDFLLSEAVVNKKVVQSERFNYIKSPFDGFYYDKLVMEKLNTQNIHSLSFKDDLNKIKNLVNNIKNGIPFVVHFPSIDKVSIVIPFINKITGEVVGSLNIFKDDTLLKKINTEEIQIKLTIFFVLAFLMIFIYREIIAKKKLKIEFNKNQKILDSQKSFIIITDGIDLKTSNYSMFEFFGYSSLKEFKKEHNCVCEFFEYEKGKNYIQEKMGDKTWFEYIKSYDGNDKIVKVRDKNGKVHLFYIEFDIKNCIDEYNYIVSFIDITKLKNIETQLIQSEKMSSLGRMIGNIAHQWRQPLSAITSAASGLKLKGEFGKLDSQSLDKNLDMIISNSKNLSKTIDTFRSFAKEKELLQKAKIQDILDSVVNLTKLSLDNNKIQLIKKIDYATHMTKDIVVGELSQVLSNILNNAIDILQQRDIKKPQVLIECHRKDNWVIISIEDNAGGVDEDIITNIFDPYFTTKHQSQGRGLDLYMSHKIVQESLNGKLYVENTNLGAKFFVEFPL